MPQDERRKSPRLHLVEIQEPVTIELNPPLVAEKMEGMLLNLSSGGMRLLVPRIIPTQFTFRLSFQPQKLAPISAEGKILWLSRRETSYVAGVSFTQIDPGDQDRISKLAEDFNLCEEKRAGGEAAFCVAACTYHPICKKPGRLAGETPVEKTGTPPKMKFPQELAKVEKAERPAPLPVPAPQAQKAQAPKYAEAPVPPQGARGGAKALGGTSPQSREARSRIAAFSLFGIIILLTAGLGVYLRYFMQKTPPIGEDRDSGLGIGGLSLANSQPLTTNPILSSPTPDPVSSKSQGDEKLALSLAVQGDIQKAIAEMKTAHPEKSDAYTLLSAKTFLESGNLDSALLSALRVLAENKEELRGWFYLGVVFKKKHLYSHASSAYDRVLALKPQSSETMYEMASLYALMGDGENAAKWLKKAAALNPGILQRAREDPQFDPIRSHRALGK